MKAHRDVVIVGAGPTGLLLAGDLAAAGLSVTVLERRAAHENNLTRAFAVHARTLEILDARGLADDLVATGARVGELRFLNRLTVDLSWLPSRFPYVLITPQYHTERLLLERAIKHGAEIMRGAEVVDVRQDRDGVDVQTDTDTDTLRASYVVGADGLRSTVRAAVGVPFPGRTVARSVMLGDVRLGHEPPDVIMANADGRNFGFVAPFGDGWYRVIAWRRDRQPPDDVPVELEEIRAVVQKALGTDYGMHDARWVSRFHSDERQVPQYRIGRVFLVGDAAHIHSPAGGQGMNTGLQDAANLGWKLAAEIQGWACPGLLDSYHAERHPVGRTVLRISGGMLRIALMPRAMLAAASAVLGTALRLRPVARRVAGTVSGIAIRYARPTGGHELAGQRAPDQALAGGGRLYEALRGGQYVLVGADLEERGDHLRSVQPAKPNRLTMLVRPDGYIAWAAERPQAQQIRNALAHQLPSPLAQR
jgi:2-polyprenyl-6-methoxyphenol hydroxylase-like FAD-dependent oxidoreductase